MRKPLSYSRFKSNLFFHFVLLANILLIQLSVVISLNLKQKEIWLLLNFQTGRTKLQQDIPCVSVDEMGKGRHHLAAPQWASPNQHLWWLTCVLSLSPPRRPLRWKDVWLQRCGLHRWWRRRSRHPNRNWQSPGENAAGRAVYFTSWPTVSCIPVQYTVKLSEKPGYACFFNQHFGIFSEVSANSGNNQTMLVTE